MDHATLGPCMATPIDMTIHEAQKEGNTQSRETKHMGLEEKIQQGNLRLCELVKEMV